MLGMDANTIVKGVPMENEISNSYLKMNHPELLAYSATVISGIKRNPVFTAMWPPQVVDIATFDGLVNAYRESYEAVEAGDKTKKFMRDNARAAVLKALTKISKWVSIVSDDDATVLASSGFHLKRERVKGHPHTAMPELGKTTIGHGALSGILVVKTDKVPGGLTCELEMTEGDPTDENAWRKAGIGIFHTFKSMEVAGLTPGRKYYFRLRIHGAFGVTPWSATVSLYSM